MHAASRGYTARGICRERWADLKARIDQFRQTRTWKWLRWPVLIGGGFFLLLVIVFFILYATVDLPDDPPELNSSVIVDAQGREIAVLAKDGLRVQVELKDISQPVKDAVIAAEDRRFYEHKGIDPFGVMRAFINDVRGRRTQGGSTITQQLVKNSYLSSERTLVRKAKEAILAMKLERKDNKDDILERYLNTVYFGRGAYGIEAAARVYFDSTASQLDVNHAALLVGMLRAPESADPATDPDAATKRRDTVINSMVETGTLTEAEAKAAKAQPLGATAASRPVTLTAGVAPFFVEWVRAQAIERFGAEAVYGGGLRIQTTLDIDDQKAAEAAVASVLLDPADPQAALVALDRDGNIKAYVGGRDFNVLQVDLARGKEGGGSGRQPGSTFKPFVLAAALQHGITLGTQFPAPATITLDAGGEQWTVDNYGEESFGVVDLTTATANSINTVYAQLMLEVGPRDAVATAKQAGIVSPLDEVVSLVLGTEEVSVLEMADAYLTFARDGEHVPATAITKVENADGDVLFEAPTDAKRAMGEDVARGVNYALQKVVEDGTGTAAQLDRPVAGKTGTTQENGDAWFAGYTPNYVAVVWMGYPEGPEHTMIDVEGVAAVTGGSLPARIWKAFMEQALADVEVVDFEPPPDEMLAANDAASALTLQPPNGDPGVTVNASGTGFKTCIEGWYLTFDGNEVTSPESGSTSDERRGIVRSARRRRARRAHGRGLVRLGRRRGGDRVRGVPGGGRDHDVELDHEHHRVEHHDHAADHHIVLHDNAVLHDDNDRAEHDVNDRHRRRRLATARLATSRSTSSTGRSSFSVASTARREPRSPVAKSARCGACWPRSWRSCRTRTSPTWPSPSTR